MQVNLDTTKVPATHSVKIRGLDGLRSASAVELRPLAETHIIFNRLVECVCQEILRLKNSASTPDEKQIASLLEVAFLMPASAGNHLLTRLVQHHGKDGSDLTQIQKINGQAEKSLEKSKGNDDQKEQQQSSQIIANCNAATLLLARRRDEKYAPWKDLGLNLSDQNRASVFCRLADLSESWQRQIFQAALESLKSHFNLKIYVEKERSAWAEKVEQLKESEEIQEYLKLRQGILDCFNDLSAKKAELTELSPKDFLSFLEQLSPKLNIEGLKDSVSALTKKYSEQAERLSASNIDGNKRSRAYAAFRNALLDELPSPSKMQLSKTLAVHQIYERSFARMPQAPTLTIPDPFLHPKYVIWNQQQWREIELGDPKSKQPWMKIRLPLLTVAGSGVVEQDKYFTIRGDRRLAGVRKEVVTVTNEDGEKTRVTQFLQTDPISGKEREIRFGGVRLLMDPKSGSFSKQPNELSDFLRADFSLKILVNRVSSKPPSWVGEYLKKKDIDPETKEPRLPAKLIVCSFVSALNGDPVMKAALIEPASYSRRKVAYIHDDKNFPVKLEVGDLKSPEQVAKLREKAEGFAKERRKLVLKLEEMPKEDKAQRKQRRALVRDIMKVQRIERGLWRHIKAVNTDRANKFAGAVARRIEALRSQYPDHEVAIALDYRADRKPNSYKWSHDFNKLLMGAAGGAVHDKVAENCARLDPPIAVLNFSTYGFERRAPRSNEPNVLHFEISKKSSQVSLKQVPHSDQVAVVTGNRISLISSAELTADNLIERLVTPSRYATMPKPAELKRILDQLWTDNSARILPLVS